MHPKSTVQILENSEQHLPEFILLNELWIREYFELEQVDLSLASNPKKIIQDGGYVFTILKGKEVIGVCALFKQEKETFQLARMAVKKDCQGMGFGNLLMNAVLQKLQQIKVKKVSLLTNSKLTTAISLYKKYGFKVINAGPHPLYKRVDMTMVLNLNGGSQ